MSSFQIILRFCMQIVKGSIYICMPQTIFSLVFHFSMKCTPIFIYNEIFLYLYKILLLKFSSRKMISIFFSKSNSINKIVMNEQVFLISLIFYFVQKSNFHNFLLFHGLLNTDPKNNVPEKERSWQTSHKLRNNYRTSFISKSLFFCLQNVKFHI